MSPPPPASVVEQAESVLAASRVFVAISAESLDSTNQYLDLTHFRALVVLASHDGMSLGEFAEAARMHPSRASRLCERLVSDGLASRETSTSDRRQIVLRATQEGRTLLDRVWTERKRAVIDILSELDDGARQRVASAMQVFAEAAGKRTDHVLWTMGWTT